MNFAGNAWLFRGVIYWAYGLLSSNPFSCRFVFENYLRGLQVSDLMGIPSRPIERSAWLEFQNITRAIQWFAASDQSSRLKNESKALEESVAAILELDRFVGIWRMEGLGFFYTSRRLGDVTDLKRLYGTETLGSIPSSCFLPLHTGAGLAIALRSIRSLDAGCSRKHIFDWSRHYVECVRFHSLPGYEGAMHEALGLVVCLLCPRSIAHLDSALGMIDPLISARFWHGYGRGLYFSPLNVLPCTSACWPSVRKAHIVPPHELGRQNAISGLGWALMLVNLRQPDVLESFLKRYGRDIDVNAFAHGVDSALTLWYDWAPNSTLPEGICQFSTSVGNHQLRDLWNRTIRRHCERGLADQHANLTRANQLDAIFDYRPPHASNETRQPKSQTNALNQTL
ncbi:MAG: hypothetical protein ABL921_04580 [Pirellula sp.]